MNGMVSVTRQELSRKRQQLKRRRRWRLLHTCWQLLLVGSIAGGVTWLVTLPGWSIRSAAQVSIEGNRFLSRDAVRSYLALEYPFYLLQVQPHTLERSLENHAAIAQAEVHRQLFPPTLKVQIDERYPVAIAQPLPGKTPDRSSPKYPVGFLDDRGEWIPLESYTGNTSSFSLPTLKVIGKPAIYRSLWEELYRAIARSPVKIYEVDWRDPGNLILKTELGLVWLGSFGDRFPDQLQTLDRMRRLPEQVDPTQIAYIDLTNPDAPALQTIPKPAAKSTPTPQQQR